MLIYTITDLERLRPLLRPTRLMVLLGDRSYSTYLIHLLVISAIGRTLYLFAPDGGVSASVMLMATSLLAANSLEQGYTLFSNGPCLIGYMSSGHAA